MSKIIFAIDTIGSGGAERVMATLASYMAAKGHEAIMVNADSSEPFYPIDNRVSLQKMNLKWDESGRAAMIKRMIKKYKYLKTLFKKEKPDVVLAFLYNMEIPAILAALRTRTKIVVSVRNSVQYYPNYVQLFRRIFYPHIKGVVFQSAAVQHAHPFNMLKNSRVIMNPLMGTIQSKMVPVDYKNRKQWIINVARLMPQKNQALLINAYARICEKYPEMELHIFGEGKLRKDLEKLIDDLNLDDRVFLEGNVPDAIIKNRDAKLFVMSSDHEGFPNALVEAMVCGIPSLSTKFDTGVAEDFIRDGENGFLCEAGNLQDMEKQIMKALDMGERLQDISERACNLFDVVSTERVCREWERYLFEEESKVQRINANQRREI